MEQHGVKEGKPGKILHLSRGNWKVNYAFCSNKSNITKLGGRVSNQIEKPFECLLITFVRMVTLVRDLHIRGFILALHDQFAKNFCNNFRRKYLCFLSLVCGLTVLRCVLKGTGGVTCCLEASCNCNPKRSNHLACFFFCGVYNTVSNINLNFFVR